MNFLIKKGEDGEMLAFIYSDYVRYVHDEENTHGYEFKGCFPVKKLVYGDLFNYISRICGSYNMCFPSNMNEDNFSY